MSCRLCDLAESCCHLHWKRYLPLQLFEEQTVTAFVPKKLAKSPICIENVTISLCQFLLHCHFIYFGFSGVSEMTYSYWRDKEYYFFILVTFTDHVHECSNEILSKQNLLPRRGKWYPWTSPCWELFCFCLWSPKNWLANKIWHSICSQCEVYAMKCQVHLT